MKKRRPSRVVLSEVPGSPPQQLELFALVNLGLVQSLTSGVLSPAEAVERFYHADNCLYVQRYLRKREANAIMSRGVQLPNLFECLPAEEARREFYHELETIRALCLKLLGEKRPRGAAVHAVA
ncbi:MAG: hypothetical protein HYT78_01480 [Deltaproteobacteria bacterium]|nr:hypothetical protein [Deltaproteobacteria bacterium]